MVNDLKDLLHENVADAPADHLDVAALVSQGRRRRRDRRRLQVAGSAALAAAAVAAGLAVGGLPGPGGVDPAARRTEPVGPVVGLSDARPAVEGRDYRTLTTQTNEDLDAANGQYLSGVTEDGLVLFTDGPRTLANSTRVALLDPATGTKDWLPGGAQQIGGPLQLTADRLVFQTEQDDGRFGVTIFDRRTQVWSQVSWPTLPADLGRADGYGEAGVDGDRLWVALPRGERWDRFDLWSVSLDDPADVRDEHTVVGDFAVGGGLLTWTDTRNEPNDALHVRDLGTGREQRYDPLSGARCNQLSLESDAQHVVLQQYCGTADGVRDDRVQVLTRDGQPVVTIRDAGLDSASLTDRGVVVQASGGDGATGGAGTYVFDFASGELERVSRGVSRFGVGGPAGGDYFLWHTPVNDGHGAKQWLGEVL